MSLQKLFEGSELLKGSLPSKGVVGIYFSAHWCPPCRGFTPKLASAYNAIKDAGKEFEIVFLSSDKDQSSFESYFAEMPWLALSWEKRELKNKIAQKFKVQGIPMLVLLDAESGSIITKEGRTALSKDPQGLKYPWVPPTPLEALGDAFVGKSESERNVKGKYVGIYFSAHWCGPCRNFTPKFAETYAKIKAKRDDFEVVFCSADEDENQFDEYFATMPWLALPFSDRDRAESLNELFGVQGIPSLVILAPDGSVVSRSAVSDVRADVEGAEFPWAPKPVQDVERIGGDLNSRPALVAFTDSCSPDAKAAVSAALLDLATERLAAAGAAGRAAEEADEGMLVCTCSHEGGSVADQLRKLCKVGEVGAAADGARLVLLDIPDGGAFYVLDPPPAGPLDAAGLRAFVAAWEAKTLARRQLRG